MHQLGLNINLPQRGFFTLEERITGKSLPEIERLLGFQSGRLSQGADFYLLSTPSSINDFEVFAITAFPGHKLQGTSLFDAINSEENKKKSLSLFRRKPLIKVVALELHLAAMKQFLSAEEFAILKEAEGMGRNFKDVIRELKRHYSMRPGFIASIEKLFASRVEIYRKKGDDINDIMYPHALSQSIEQWKLIRSTPARCICRLTDYSTDRYSR